MKIECDIHEFNELQNKAALENQTQQTKDLLVELAAHRAEYNRLEDKFWEAKDKVRQLELGNNPTLPVSLTLDNLSEIFMVYLNTRDGYSNKIAAIKKVRELFQCGLKEAKDVVEGNFHRT